MLYRHPVIGGELLDDPLTAESANAAVLLSIKRIGGTDVNTAAMDMSHPWLDAQGKTQASSLIGREDYGRHEPSRTEVSQNADSGCMQVRSAPRAARASAPEASAAGAPREVRSSRLWSTNTLV